jgi:hypothetical protein
MTQMVLKTHLKNYNHIDTHLKSLRLIPELMS